MAAGGRFAAVDDAVRGIMARWGVPGASVAIIANGATVHHNAYGLASTEAGIPVSPGSLFRIGSLSKTVTAIAALHLAQRDGLDLDRGILDYLAPAGNRNVFAPELGAVTVRHLLTMRAGFADEPDLSWHCSLARGPVTRDTRLTVADILHYFPMAAFETWPGRAQRYEQISYHILGRVIEVVSGMRYEDYVKRHLLQPIGLERPFIGSTPRANAHRDEVTYYWGDDTIYEPLPFLESRVPDTVPYAQRVIETRDSNGGWVFSSDELARLLYAGVIDPRSPLLSRESQALLFARPEVAHPNPDEYFSHGMFCRPNTPGWLARTFRGGSLLPCTCRHIGRSGGSSGMFGITSHKLVWVILLNRDLDNYEDYFADVGRTLWGVLGPLQP